jgi:ABC-type antimicrobial peptide transport system permease subunit
MALGAGKNETLGLVMREVALLGLIGMAAGLPLALYATRYFSSLLFDVPAWDAPTFVGAAILLAAVLIVAGFVPARRATNIEPVSALRDS